MMSPEDFFNTVNSMNDIGAGSDTERKLTEFIQNSSARDLEQALLLCLRISTIYNVRWIQQAETSLSIRIAEQAAESTNKLIQHTEKLTKQTDIHIQHSEKLTRQTDKLVNETVKLTWLTISLGIFAIVQIIIMVFDYLKHK
jgi:hypothetical protein